MHHFLWQALWLKLLQIHLRLDSLPITTLVWHVRWHIRFLVVPLFRKQRSKSSDLYTAVMPFAELKAAGHVPGLINITARKWRCKCERHFIQLCLNFIHCEWLSVAFKIKNRKRSHLVGHPNFVCRKTVCFGAPIKELNRLIRSGWIRKPKSFSKSPESSL